MFIHWFQIISDFLYVYQSVHYLSSLLKIGYQWYLQFWMSYLSQIFWRYSWEVCSLFSNNFMFFVCLSVCSLPHFVTEISLSMISLVLDEISFKIRRCLRISYKSFQISYLSVVYSWPDFLTEISVSMISPDDL